MEETTPKRRRGRPTKAEAEAAKAAAAQKRNLVTATGKVRQRVLNPPTSSNQIACAPKSLSEQADERRAQQMAIVLEVLATGQSATAGAMAAGINYSTPYVWRREFPAFAIAWDEAALAGTHVAEDEAHRRAIQGVERPVYQAGKLAGHVVEYSDNLLIRFLERRSADWRQARAHLEVTGAGGGPIQIEAVKSRVLGKLAALAGGPVIDVTPASIEGPRDAE